MIVLPNNVRNFNRMDVEKDFFKGIHADQEKSGATWKVV